MPGDGLSWWQRNGTRSVLLVGGLLSVAAYFVQIRLNEQIVQEQTQAEADKVANQSVRAMTRAALGLRAARGFVLGAGLDHLSSDRFLAYFQSRDLAKEFPGVTGVGVIRRVAAGQQQAYVADVRRRDQSHFEIRQLSPNEGERRVIEFVEPVANNGPAIGLDVASEAQRHVASEQALTSDEPALTGPVQLLQSRPEASKGLLMLMRLVADAGGTRYGIEAGSRGYAYSPIQLDELLSKTDAHSHLVAMALDDVTDPAQPQSFALPVERSLQVPWGPLTVERDVMGRKWRFTVSPTPALIRSLRLRSPASDAFIGVVATLLLAGWVSVSSRMGRRTRQGLDERTQLLGMLEQAGDAVIGLDRQQRVTLWNQAAANLFGFQPDECLGRPIAELTVPADHRDEEDQLMRDALSGRGTSPFETRRKNRAGELIDVEVWAVPLSNGKGQIVGMVKQIRPIHERVRERLQLQEHGEALERLVQERTQQLELAWKDLQSVIDAIPSVVASWDCQLRNRFINRAAIDFWGWRPQDILGRHVSELLGPELFKANLPFIQQALAGEVLQFERVIPIPGSQEQRPVLIHYIPQRQGDAVVGFYVLVQDVSEVVRSRTALQALQREQQATLDALNQIVLVSVTDRRGKIEQVNDEFCRLAGFERAELIGRTHTLVSSGLHPPEFWQQMWRTILSGAFWRGEICDRAKDGTLFWVNTAIVPIRDAHGQVERFMSIRFDITERKAMEQALTQSEAMLARTGEIGHIGGWEWDVDGGAVRWSAETCRILGLPLDYAPTAAELVPFYPPDMREVLRDAPDELAKGRARWDTELSLQRADGSLVWVRTFGEIVQSEGGAIRVLGAIQDITAQHDAQEALLRAQEKVRRSEEMLQQALVATRTAIAIFDETDRLEMCNQRYRDMYPLLDSVLQQGTSFETILRAYVERYAPRDAVANAEAFIQARMRTHRQGGEWVRHLSDGRYIRIVERELSGGKLATLLADVTELAQAREEAESASRAKSEFLASTSHEIRTPLNAILGLAYMLERADLPSEQHGQVRQIAQAGRSLLALVSDVLDLSKIEAGQLEVDEVDFDLRALVDSEMALHAASATHKALHTVCEVDPDVPALVHGDLMRLRQIVGNLLSNAMKFTEKGSVTLQVRKGATEPLIELTVIDTGIGIEPSVQVRLFRPFEQADATTTRRYGGTGLGLAICAKLVKLMNGSLTVSSQPGQGSSFTVTLPLPAAQVQAQDHADVGHSDHIWLSGIQILVVDDSPLNLDVARLVLELEGACVYTAANGEDALKILMGEQGEQFDAVLLDVQMPLMDGYEVAKQIRRIAGLEQLPVVALSAGVTHDERERALLAGMNDFLSKPLDPPRMIRCLRGLVESYRGILIPVRPRTEDALMGMRPAAGTVLGVAGVDETHIAPSLLSDRPLLLSMLARLLDEFGDMASTPRSNLPAVLHKLKGSAMVMGAMELAQAASEAEAALAIGSGILTEGALARVSRKLAQLKESAREVLAGEAERLQAEQERHLEASGTVEPLTPVQWTELQALLAKQSARSLQKVEELSGPLLSALGPARLSQLRLALNAFDFELAIVALGDAPSSEMLHG